MHIYTTRRSLISSVALAGLMSQGWCMAEAQSFAEDATAYADAMLEYGTDRYGDEHTAQFVSILSRVDQPTRLHEGNIGGANKKLPGWEGRYYNRDWGGGNLNNHVQLHVLLGELSEATGDPKYLEASKAAIEFTFKNTQSPETGLLAWGEHMSWDVDREVPYPGQKPVGQPHDDTHEPSDRFPPVLWDRAYSVAPDAAFKFAQGLWDHQVIDQSTGTFSRHARYTKHGPNKYVASFPRVGGWMILAWTEAYKRSEDSAYRDTMLQAIETLITLYEGSRSQVTGAIPAGVKTPGVDAANHNFTRVYWMQNNLLFAAELEFVVNDLPSSLTGRIRALQSVLDETVVTKLEHNLDGHLSDMPVGFQHRGRPDLPLRDNGTMQLGDGRFERFDGPASYSTDWAYGYGAPITSDVGNAVMERYRANRDPRFLELAVAAADRYMQVDPSEENLTPMAMSAPIDLLVAVSQETGETKYLERAEAFGRIAEQLFLDGNPLPKATSSHDFYEAITGGDELMLSLWRLSRAPKPQ